MAKVKRLKEMSDSQAKYLFSKLTKEEKALVLHRKELKRMCLTETMLRFVNSVGWSWCSDKQEATVIKDKKLAHLIMAQAGRAKKKRIADRLAQSLTHTPTVKLRKATASLNT